MVIRTSFVISKKKYNSLKKNSNELQIKYRKVHITTIETKPIQYLNYFSKMCCSRINKQLIRCCHLEHSPGLFCYFWFCFVLVAFVSLRFHFRDNSFDHKNPRQRNSHKNKILQCICDNQQKVTVDTQLTQIHVPTSY